MFDHALEARILDIVNATDSVAGMDLVNALDNKHFEIWRTCNNSEKIYTTPFGRYYLRIDDKVEGLARLSPSILRGFLTYTRISTLENAELAARDAKICRAEHERISDEKRSIARQIVKECLNEEQLSKTGVLIAGDVCRNMAHLVPRPERSTGKLVNGSDIDLIFIIEDDPALKAAITEAVIETKNIYLQHPALREEIDFVVNTLPHYHTVSQFQTAKQMISCKAALEGEYLTGNASLTRRATDILMLAEIPKKIIHLTERAFSERIGTMERLRKDPDVIGQARERRLFYFSDEIWEFMLD